MADDQLHIVTISSNEEAVFAQKFLTRIIAVSFNENYISFSPNDKTAFIYSTKQHRSIITTIFQDPNIIKLISKPLPALKSFLKDIACNNCQHISEYMDKKGDSRSIPEMKREIIEQNEIGDIMERVGSISLVMMKYKTNADMIEKTGKVKKKNLFNKRRDCYLLYLTVFNDILIQNGPLQFVTLASMAKTYPYLCRTKLNTYMALEGLIKVGALSLDRYTTIVSIPDQLP